MRIVGFAQSSLGSFLHSAGMVTISVKSNVDQVERSLNTFVRDQVPFATAQAINALAKRVQAAEIENMRTTFRNPSPFTLRSVRMTTARKSSPEATVFVMDKAAQYLVPYEYGGVHQLPGPALFNPKDIQLNGYGQLTRGIMAKLRGRSDIYIGPIKTSNGVVNGVWQRLDINRKGQQRRQRAGRGGLFHQQLGALKLLIRFGDALPVTQHLDYMKRAQDIVNANFTKEFGRALGKALATSR